MSASGSSAPRGDSTPTPVLVTLGTISSADGALADQHQLVTLLAYLAHNGPTDRQHLATIFWPHAPKPLNNLSSALTRIRRVSSELVQADRHNVHTPCTTDAHQMLAAINNGNPRAAMSYAGHFLAGFSIKGVGIELEEWIFDQRESIAGAVVASLTEQSRDALSAQDRTRAADLAERAIDVGVDVVDISPHLATLNKSLEATNRPSAVRVRSLAHEAGIDLTANAIAPPAIEPPQSLWGRGDDLARLIGELKPGAVVNLFGLGGVGKTMLARQLRTSDTVTTRFPGGVHLVELLGETDGGRVHAAVYEALDLTPRGATPIEELADAVDAATLVVLDDVQATASHSLADTQPTTDAVAQLAGHQGLCVLVLSRLRFEAEQVRVVPLRGLDIGKTHREPGPAVAHFTECAGSDVVDRVGAATFERHAYKICEQLSGLPLALELTAAWLRLLPTSEVLTILDDDEILNEAPPGEDVSLSHVIEQSWDLLPTHAQRALGSLSVMRGGFSRTAAREVASIGIRELTELHDHSLIEIDEHGLMRCHPLIQAFAKRKLAEVEPALRNELEMHHRRWFMEHLVETMATSGGQIAGDQMETLRQAQENLESAWNSMVAAEEWTQLSECLGPLDQFLLRSGQIFRADRMYTLAFDHLYGGDQHLSTGLLAALANNLAWVRMLLANPDGAQAMCDVGLKVLAFDDVPTHIALLRTECALLGNAGDATAALDGYKRARELAGDLDDLGLRALLDEDIGRAHALLGQHEEAIEAFRHTLDAGRLLGDVHMEARSYLMIGVSKLPTDPSHSLVLFDQGERLAQAHGLTHLLAYFPSDRALALVACSEFGRAVTEFERAIELADEAGDHVLRVIATLDLARARMHLEEWEAAENTAAEGLRLAIRAQLWPPCLGVGLELAASILQRQPTHERAQRVAAFALQHPNVLLSDHVMFHDLVTDAPAPKIVLHADARLDEVCELILQLFHT